MKGQVNVNPEASFVIRQPDSLLTLPKNQLKSAGLILGVNLGVWAYDLFIVGGNYARVNLNTIKYNFRTGFTGDNDGFMTNLLSHPYHGNIYYNTARSNGMNFWQSIPYVALGSLTWEFFLENEPASINDFISSTIGGSCLGEMCYRISDHLLDDRSVGFERFKREALLTVISPLRGLNRILNGDAWRHRTVWGNTVPSIPVTIYSNIGYRFLSENYEKNSNVSQMVCYDVGVFYGNPFDPENEKPYDFFNFKIAGNLFSRQSEISQVNAIGMLYTKSIFPGKHCDQLIVGIFQHFNFYQFDAEKNRTSISSYKISEAASVGPGLLFKSNLTPNITFSGSFHLSANLLGGYQNDYRNSRLRNYNMGSGYSTKINLELQVGKKARLFINKDNYQIYSWIGNLPNIPVTIGENERGEKGSARLNILTFNLTYQINDHLFLTAQSGRYYRRNSYTYYSEIIRSLNENKLSIGYVF